MQETPSGFTGRCPNDWRNSIYRWPRIKHASCALVDFTPGLKNRFCFLSYEFYWDSDKQGKPRLFRRTGRKRLQTAKRNLQEYIKENRHMKTSLLLASLTAKLRGHYNYFGVIGNLAGLYPFKH